MVAKKEYLWKGISETFQKNLPQDLWRAHSDAVNKALLMRWWPVDKVDQLLKTDLFDEAANEGLYPFLDARANHVLGMDISFPVASQARLRYPGFQTIEADLWPAYWEVQALKSSQSPPPREASTTHEDSMWPGS